ncbi:exonuclease domain-containing protein [Alkalilimnicola ehrlichii MLHE-1]|uniref:DNA-directed DNA polymerase n=1 Tax=Alkalilimnicola ehrlichii (strain ATCC BAA-1101 / DSM 17681 / MLHE-1) TaxID=187272 RepID=Q0A6Z2_ALKEH|nr:exonuclease domain-containing protein [Alkalilimnicola ehrlichii]ABI57395.1 putative PAS/PAC sensor protein [Alkalilimnicola ehrlichii MLHE-1]
MRQRPFVTWVLTGAVAVAAAIVVLAVYSVTPSEPGGTDNTALVASLGVLGVVAVGLVSWLLLERLLMRPSRKLSRGVRALLESRQANQEIILPRRHALGDLPTTVESLADALRKSRRETRKAMQSATAELSEQKTWLETILQGLSEGVLVCNRQHQIMLYNRAAGTILGHPEAIGLGRPLFNVLSSPPVQHTLERLERRHKGDVDLPTELSAPFVCTSADAQRMFHGRMALIQNSQGQITGYLITLVDISSDLTRLAQGDAVRRALTRDLRGVVGNLRAAAETVASYPDMKPEERQSFDAVIRSESEKLSEQIDELAHQIRGYNLGRWPMADVFVGDLVNCLQQRLMDLPDVRLTLVGLPLWVHGDSLSLMLALDCLVRQVHDHTGATAFDVEALLGDTRVYVDISWQGEPITTGELNRWMAIPCGGDEVGGQHLGDILERHGCEPWSQTGRREGQALLRLPLMMSRRPQFMEEEERLPARPEFYDFGLMQEYAGDEALAARRLADLSFVVFDCEMTGLNPEGGDEIISIAGVRVVNGRVLTGETFDRIINPGRPIPPGSVRFHGITDDDVQDKPPIEVVLPQFKSFVGDAVLVAHNAAFDMKFISMKEREAGVRFDNPVLDTLLLSALLDGDEEDHSLDALCDRYGIAITGRHTALGDTLATAELLVRIIERLEAQGYQTFGEVMKASRMAAELRHRSAVFSAQGEGMESSRT